ncbi:MAG: hypothetical protein WAX77_08465 [Methylococcaceae bacterium]
MQITADIDSHHADKLDFLKAALRLENNALIQKAIDVLYEKQQQSQGQKTYQILQEVGFIGCIEGDGDLSENYKHYLDWSHKV